jgi:HEAT repeat protein
MRVDQEIEKLKTDIFSGDRDKMKEAVNRLFAIGGQDNIDYLIELLDQENSLVRNEVAMTFMDNKFNQALEPLLNSISKAENINARGTMVYALQALDCSHKLKELFEILFTATKNWEVQSGVLTVLEEQEFEFTRNDLIDIKDKWERLKENWNDLNGIEKGVTKKAYEIDSDIIQDFVDGYVSYLEKS